MIPSGIYTDLGAKGLREMLFDNSQITGLFGISNEKGLFEGVHHALRFCVLSWVEGQTTDKFPAGFRINPTEAVSEKTLPDLLYNKDSQIEVSTALVRKLAPDSLSVMEFRNDEDLRIAQKLLEFPLLGEQIEGKWNLKLANEFHMTADSHLYQTSEGEGLFPLIEGKCFWQFDSKYAPPKYWVDVKDARERLARKQTGKTFDYENYRVAFRDVSPSSNIRTVIATVLAPNRFCPHTVTLEKVGNLSNLEKLYLAAIFNSFVYDSFMRKQCNGHVSFFYVYNSPVPRLTSGDAEFDAIVSASARLICTTAEFDDLAREVGLSGHAQGAATPDERAALRAQLDARIARLYGLNETEFAHILATFPLVDEPTKLAARNAFRDLERGVE